MSGDGKERPKMGGERRALIAVFGCMLWALVTMTGGVGLLNAVSPHLPLAGTLAVFALVLATVFAGPAVVMWRESGQR